MESTGAEAGAQGCPDVLSAFAAAGPRLRENGISVLPIAPASKAPGRLTGQGWRPEGNWSRFCTRLPTALELSFWERWQGAGVGAALGPASAPPGYQLVAIDLDSDDPSVAAAVFSTIPPSPLRKAGRKGHTAFYRAGQGVTNRSFNDARGARLLDLLCNGRQTVLPPTTHPEGGAYRWLTPDTLEDFAVADLPLLPDDVADRLAQALAPWGCEAQQFVGRQGSAVLDGRESVHRQLNDAALANLDAWVPPLQLHGCVRSGGGYRAVAHWRPSASGRPLAKRSANLSIAPEGIRDWGDADKGYSPLDLIMVATGAPLDDAFRWLQERVAPAKPIILKLRHR